jgi:propanol-preferring alcohol dehydrogenase
MLLKEASKALVPSEVDLPPAQAHEVRVKVLACGVCRTDRHIFDGDLKGAPYPIILGHEIVGEVDEIGSEVRGLRPGDRVGIPWLGHTCGKCRFCKMGRENLCDAAAFTGYHIPGGYAEFTVAHQDFCFPLDTQMDPVQQAPLLCAGLIGYRSYRKCGEAKHLGLYGFGAAAHLIAQIALRQGRKVYAFTRPGDTQGQAFAKDLGVYWAGGSDQSPPHPLDAAILFAPVGALVPQALKATRKGGRVVCAGIHMSEIPSFPYELLWGEREVISVANLTRQDGEEFFQLVAEAPLQIKTHAYPLERANEALSDLAEGKFEGAAVLVP